MWPSDETLARDEAIAIRLEAITITSMPSILRPPLLGWRPPLVGWRQSLVLLGLEATMCEGGSPLLAVELTCFLAGSWLDVA